jgi:DNA-directed RNA polymerase subunit RPC12/RpoP
MENYSDLFKNKFFPCPLCQKQLDIRMSDKGKPYIICDACGIQLFVRKSEGINRMAQKVNSWWG